MEDEMMDEDIQVQRQDEIEGEAIIREEQPQPQPQPQPHIAGPNRYQWDKSIVRRVLGREFGDETKHHFVHQCNKQLVSRPTVWRYDGFASHSNAGLGEMTVQVQTPNGLVDREVLVAAGRNGNWSIINVNPYEQLPDDILPTLENTRNVAWPTPPVSEKRGCRRAPELYARRTYFAAPPISSLKLVHGNRAFGLLTTLRNKANYTHGGLWYIDFSSGRDRIVPYRRLASSPYDFWTTDCNESCKNAAVGTSEGVAMIDLERPTLSWVCWSTTDVLSQRLDKQGNTVLCGLGNGEILTVDARERQTAGRVAQRVCGFVNPSSTVHRNSGVCSLVALDNDEHYYLASTLDGTVNLYDHRMPGNGLVRGYYGHVNSNTVLPLGVDPSEQFVVADRHLRIWYLKSGELLFDEEVFGGIPSSLVLEEGFWKGAGNGEHLFQAGSSFHAWCGTEKELYYAGWP
ncbi:DDB1- and CUL4-associated factor 4-like protein 1 [Linum grandiflorum]